MNKKGMELSMNFIIIAALALIALIVIALIFTGGIEKIIGQQNQVLDLTTSERLLAEGSCQTACNAGSKGAWDNPDFPESLVDKGFDNCDNILGNDYWKENCQ
ncbi:MAG: hypothetical protein ABIJ18_05150 [archaeon]